MIPWQEAWQRALYGESGFYRRPEGPRGHFTTAAHGGLGDALAATVLGLADAHGLHGVLDLGAGRGELLRALHRADPARPLVGVDVVDRPADLDPGTGWVRSPGGAGLPAPDALAVAGVAEPADWLVVANEWLDVVPCPVAEADDDGALRLVLVDGDAPVPVGAEALGAPLSGDDLRWAHQWWPGPWEPGRRVEVGLPRDSAWGSMVTTWQPGLALAVDYAHTRSDRPAAGTLVGYRDGTTCAPVPDGSSDLTAHVAVDSLPHQVERLTQREAVRRHGPPARTPEHDRARTDPAGYLADLAAASAAGALTAPGLGDFVWVLSRPPSPVT